MSNGAATPEGPSVGEQRPDAGAPTPEAGGELEALRERLRQSEQRLLGIQRISEIAQLLATDRDFDRVLEEVGTRTAELMGCERATLFLVAEDKSTLVAKVRRASPSDEVIEIEVPLGQGIAGWVANHGRAVNVKDAYRDPRFDPKVDGETGFRTRSLLCLPLRDQRERPLGVLQALNKHESYFSTADEVLLETLASQASIVIRNSRLFADLAAKHHALLDTQVRLKERNSEMDLMFAIERAAALARDQDEALEGALNATLAEYPCEAAAVLLLDDDDDEDRPAEARRWRVCRTAGALGKHLDDQTGTANEPLLREALCAGRDVVLFDHPELPEVPKLLAGFSRIESLAVIPLAWRGPEEAEGQVLGAFALLNSRRFPKGFDDLDRHKLRVIGSRMALSVTLARALDEERKAERMAAIGGALSSIVHDLRTPLTLLDGYARLMARKDDAEERRSLRLKHKRQIEVVNTMIHDVLAFARGRSQVLPRKVWVREFLGEIEEMLEIELAESTVRPTVVAGYTGAVRMDAAKMKRVVTNLVRNAREAMGASGGELTIRVDADADKPGWVRLGVRDTGPGIPEEMEGRLFESFASFGKINGTGLGLAIVKKIVDQHEGTLEVTSAPGRGTEFSIGLPTA